MEKERFSLLLLDPGEIYFEDFSAFSLPIDATTSTPMEGDLDKKQIGRLKMCSKSILFDPKDIKQPIIKIPLKDCQQIYEWNFNLSCKSLSAKSVIAIKTTQYMEMLAGNVLAPYTFKTVEREFLFLLNYAKISDCLPQISQLHRASTLAAGEQMSMIAAIVFSRQTRVSFDSLWLGDLYESKVLETQGNRVTPLVINPGRILLTSARLYFQPFNNVEAFPVLKIDLADLTRVVKRRFVLQQVGLEVYCSSQVAHLYLTVKTTQERDAIYDAILAQSACNLPPDDQQRMTLQWQNGAISNYDYLLYINSLSDRTFNDLTQYPVFPWVVADYKSPSLDLEDPATYRDLSRPIGALNPTRLQRLKERYDEMPPPRFMYGSHYSTPGFVLFYLVRKFPHLMLCLHNGRFDHPDRLFNSIADTWSNVLTNMADFKELVPEFYAPEQDGGFLVNTHGINFGHRHDGAKICDVALPPWAKDARDFVQKLRDALESEHVSNNLHHWIDLIFGYKQRGVEAVKADNVFYHLCYEGSVDLGSILDCSQRQATEVQIMEFGQIPKQVFQVAHPMRRTNGVQAWRSMDTLALNSSFLGHRSNVLAVALANAAPLLASVGQDGQLKLYQPSKQLCSVAISSLALAACVMLPDGATLILASWDNNITVFNCLHSRISDSFRAHEDAVSCLAWDHRTQLLASGSWDCSVRVWRSVNSETPVRVRSALVAQFDHEAHISCLAFSSVDDKLASGTCDGDLFLWSLEDLSLMHQLPGHQGAVNAVSFNRDGSKLVSCGDDGLFRVLDVATRMHLYSKTLDQELKCLAWDGLTLLLGGSLGHVLVWDLVQVRLIASLQAHDGPVLALAASLDGSLVVTGGSDRQVKCWRPAGETNASNTVHL